MSGKRKRGARGLKGRRKREKEELKDYNFLHSFASSEDKTATDISVESHPSIVVCGARLVRNGPFCDITLIVGPEKHQIKCHRLVLASTSDYYQVMFSSKLMK